MSAWTQHLLLSLVWPVVVCQTAWDAKNLTTYLFQTNSYNSRIRPVINQTKQIYVSVDFHLIDIDAIDDVAETLRTTGYLSITWQDTFLVWDPAEFGGLTYYHWPQNDIWKPDVTLKNSNLDYKQLGDSSLQVRVEHTGQVTWEPYQIFESKCPIDITNFPFDTQKCSLKFDSWSYSIKEVYMQGGSKGLVLSHYQSNSEWDLTNTEWYTVEEDGEATLVFDLTLQRKALYDSLTLIFPITMLAILDLFVFILPFDSGEKASYAVTIFLSIAVFFTIVEASFPSSSATFAYFAVYMTIQTVQSVLATLAALVIIRCGSLDEQRHIPKFLQLVTCMFNCSSSEKKYTEVDRAELNNKTRASSVTVDKGENKTKSKLSESHEPVSSQPVYTWKQVANALDKLFFIFFLCVFIASTLVCILVSVYN